MDPQHTARDEYSTWMGLIYVFNLIVGTGALTLPAAFAEAGWLLSTILITLLAFISFITVTFVIECMACANATVQWRRLRFLKKDRSLLNSDQNSEISDDSASDTSDDSLLLPNTIRYYELDRKFELGEMSTLFFNRFGRVLFYCCFAVYLYGDLSIYSVAVAKSLTDVSCTFTPDNFTTNETIPMDDLCWSGSELTRNQAYRIFLGAFILTLGPFVFFNLKKTQYLQLLTTLMRWIAFTIMIGIALQRLITLGPVGNPKLFNFHGVPALFGTCIYSFMCHHSLPSLLTPVKNKNSIKKLVMVDYFCICLFYLLLALTGTFAFQHLDQLYTLNFIPNSKDNVNIFFQVVDYFLALFPVFTLSTSFPIIAITLKNNLQNIFLDMNRINSYNVIVREFVFPILAIGPPFMIAFFIENVTVLVGITGSYAGNGIQYLIPAFLVLFARRTCSNIIGADVKNQYGSPFQGLFWIAFVILWSLTCLVFVTINICRDLL